MPEDVSQPTRYIRVEGNRWQFVNGAVVREGLIRLHVNGQEVGTLMCTPDQLDLLALGFLRSGGIIADISEVRLLRVCPSETCVEVWLKRSDFELPGPVTITSGCGGGITFADLMSAARPLDSALRVSPQQLGRLMRAMQAGQQTRGIHTSALAEGERLVAVAQDVGRHNTIDKLWGHCLVAGIPTQDKILLSTGRISSEMLHKAAQMGVPVVASRTSPTSLSVALAAAWNVTLVGYVRRDSLNVYAAEARVTEDREENRNANE